METDKENPNLSPAPDKMVAAAPKAKKLVKMEILRDTEVNMPDVKDPVVKVKGSIVMVEEAEAIRLVEKTVDGTFGFTGERDGNFPRQTLRAARPWREKKEVLKQKDPLNPLNFEENFA